MTQDDKKTASATRPHKQDGAKKQLYARRRFKSASLGAVASKLLAPTMRRKGFMQNEIVAKWGEIVGPELAAATVPVSLKFPRGKRLEGKLTVRCTSAFAPLLQHKKPHVLDAVNRYFGYGAVADIYITHGPLPNRAQQHRKQIPQTLSPEREAQLDQIIGSELGAETDDNKALAESLKRLGRAVKHR